jgi:hypothetical protein
MGAVDRSSDRPDAKALSPARFPEVPGLAWLGKVRSEPADNTGKYLNRLIHNHLSGRTSHGPRRKALDLGKCGADL